MADTMLNGNSTDDKPITDNSINTAKTEEPKEESKPVVSSEPTPEPKEGAENSDDPGKKPKVNVFGKDGLLSSKEQSLGEPFYNLSLIKNVDVINVNIQGMNQTKLDVDDIRDTVLDINVTFSGEEKTTTKATNGTTIYTPKSEWIKYCN
jgi:hypothetical protein